MSFFRELKERNVVKVALIYIVTAWVLAQVADLALPAFGAPEWVLRVFLFFLLLGFPVALIMAWALELTPEGVKRAEVTVGEKRMWSITALLAVAAVAWFQYAGPELGRVGVTDQSIAVLPFSDLSPQGDQQYFGDGIAEEILNLLAQNPELRVAGRTSSFKFRGEETDLRDVGRQLSVAHVLEGSVRKSGERLRITAQLIDAETGYHLWSDTFDTEVRDVFAVQDRIGRSIVQALNANLQGGAAASSQVADIDAYGLVLRGRALVAARGAYNIRDGIDMFEAAAIIDPNYADAWGELAFASALALQWHLGGDPIDYATLSEMAAERALALDPQNAAAYVGVGMRKMYSSWDWEGAEAALLRAFDIAPGSSRVANFLGDFYGRSGDLDKQKHFETLAVDLDPLFAINHHDLAEYYLLVGDGEKAYESARRFEELTGPIPNSSAFMMSLIRLGRWEEAEAHRDKLVAAGGEQSFQAYWAELTWRASRNDVAGLREYVARIVESGTLDLIGESQVGMAFAAVGECDEAAYWMEIAYEKHIGQLTHPAFKTSAAQCPGSKAWQAFWRHPEMKALSDLRIANGSPSLRFY
ncbi:MAG: hypothetical protein R3270_06025 [Gammaproteobacteria bacterium]|nr:hypothetical protein [Gammaproteobacteria bacterium]